MHRMPSTPALTPRLRAFLEQPLAASLASVDATGTPHQAVVWYALQADGTILLNSNAGRRWCTNLQGDPRVALSVIDPADPYSWIGIMGTVEEVVTDVTRSREDIVALAHRYHPDGPSQSSIDLFRSQPRVTFVVRITGIHDHLEA
jgi:PPOX class probable F420-dependent enzyme